MTVRLYDSARQETVDFSPRVPGEVGLYVCGPTVQSGPHIGHLRSALVYDLWRRWFEYRGYRVTLVRNVTDIDDKVLQRAAATAGTDHPETWWQLAYRVELVFARDYAALGIRPPSYEPRATGHLPHMIELVQRLVERGHAYAADDGSGDVYFDTASWPEYGRLTRQSRDDMVDAADADTRGKRDPRDFALWKGRKADEPDDAAWASPWGAGRPGWHLECSAMATRYLGETFDIHGGGLDLRFPHHENELAQSAAAGDGFARYWLHNGLVNITGQKMSKSIGNTVSSDALFATARPMAVRYFLASAHYRSTLEFGDGALLEAQAALDRIEAFVGRAGRAVTPIETEVPAAFAAALDDDLNVPQALAVLHETVRAGNSSLDDQRADDAAEAAGRVRAMLAVLGLTSSTPRDAGAAETALGVLLEGMLEERRIARAERDFARADSIRDRLAAAGVAVEDTPNGPQWSIDG